MEATVAEQEKSYLQQLQPHPKVQENQFSAEALRLLPQIPFPTSKDEFWKYTRTGKIKNGNFTQQAPQGDTVAFEGFFDQTITLHNGMVVDKGNPAGFEVKTLEDLSTQELEYIGTVEPFHRGVFNLSHQAYFQDCLFLKVPANTQKAQLQINLTVSGTEVVALPRLFVCAEENSTSEIILNIQGGTKQQFQHLVAEFILESGARCNAYMVQQGETEFLITDLAANVHSNATFATDTLCFSGDWVRNNIDVSIIGEGAHTDLRGLVMPSQKQHVDNHTMINHCVPNTTSSETYKNIVSDRATAIFNGKIMVHQDAQKTNAYQNSANILLGDNATVNAKPELEIYADDVKCSHGSTTGQLNKEALFYLKSRGIREQQAKNLLLKAFAAEVIEEISVEPLHNWIDQQIDRKL